MRVGSLGPVELMLIVLAIVMIFGASKLGDVGAALGKSVRDFKKASREEEPEQPESAARAPGTDRERVAPVLTHAAPTEHPLAVTGPANHPPDSLPR